MSRTSRRSLLAGVLALAALPAAASDKLVDPKKVFRYLDEYQKLPAAERSRFRINYYLHVGPQPLTAPVWLVEGAKKTQLPLRATDGRVERLPTSAQLETAKIQIGVDEGVKVGLTIGIETLAPTVEMDARDVAAALAQAAAGLKKAAGIMAMALPKLSQVSFVGVASGEVIAADGKRAPLPLVRGAPTFKPSDYPTARTLKFPKAPSKGDMG